MSLREMLQAEVDRLEEKHTANVGAYRAAKAHVREAQEDFQALENVASESANELAAAREALAALDKQQGRTVNGAGAVKAGAVQ